MTRCLNLSNASLLLWKLQELLREANITGDTTWEQARPLLELNATFASLPEAERRLAFDAAVAEKKRQARRLICQLVAYGIVTASMLN
jgi:FF domain